MFSLKYYLVCSDTDMVATGGRGDREIFVYKASKTGKFAKQHCLRGHTGWIIQLLFDTENHLLSGSEDATIRLWHVVSGKIIAYNQTFFF